MVSDETKKNPMYKALVSLMLIAGEFDEEKRKAAIKALKTTNNQKLKKKEKKDATKKD